MNDLAGGKPKISDEVRAAILVATGEIASGVLSKAPGLNEAVAQIDRVVVSALTSLVANLEKIK